jgi:leucyl/phenylalanyl-tRNA--protein transferase
VLLPPIPHPHRLTPGERHVVLGVVSMYSQGWFPMVLEEGEGARWVRPPMRALIPLDERFRVPRSLRQRVRSGRFIVTTDAAFSRVIRACADPRRGREETWLNEDIIETFELLHRAGYAHSVEAWLASEGTASTPPPKTGSCRLLGTPDVPPGAKLVGGLYGLALGEVFCGESMFSLPEQGGTDASKVCLVHLVEHLRLRGFRILDAQLHSEHLEQFGLYEIPHREYAALLRAHIPAPGAPW